MLGKIYLFILNLIRSSKIITFFIWGIKIKKYCHSTFWDLTTLVIKKELNFTNKKNYLDMGCGQFAILGQYYKKNNPTSMVMSVDIYEDFVNNSILNSKENKNDIKIFQSNLFENIRDKFDLISFNPPYVPEVKDNNIQYSKIRYSGHDGTELMSVFLNEAKKSLSNDGVILLGINNFYVTKEDCLNVIKRYDYKVKRITKMPFNTSVVFVLQ
jgi:methylase of polypeptide subunit release factors